MKVTVNVTLLDIAERIAFEAFVRTLEKNRQEVGVLVPAPPEPRPAIEATPDPVAAPPVETVVTAEPVEGEITVDTMRAAMMDYVDRNGKNVGLARDLLGKYGVSKLSEVPPEKRAAFLNDTRA